MRRRVTYRPSKGQSAFSAVVCGIFVLIGIFFVIPNTGGFGVLWTLIALFGAGTSAYHAFGKGYIGPEIHIEDEEGQRPGPAPAADLNAKARLEQLETLREAGLIDEEEYQAKRREILESL